MDILINAGEVCALLGISRTALRKRRIKHNNFPEPILRESVYVYWDRRDIEKWIEVKNNERR